MPQKLTQADVIKRFKAVHSNQFDYSRVKYINTARKVIIGCPEHGFFEQSPHKHASGQGCPKCRAHRIAAKLKISDQEFIRKANEVHGNRYDYSKIVYKNNRTKIIIICKEHGEFQQRPSDHLNGSGCPKCGNIQSANQLKSNTQEFLKKAEAVHGDKYDYSQVIYEVKGKNVVIGCPDHGAFVQTPHNHLHGYGCPECGRIRTVNARKGTTELFITKARVVHGNRYDYSKVDYQNALNRIIIICREHGGYTQQPYVHLNGHGCADCAIIQRADKRRTTPQEFIEKAKAVHSNKYDYSQTRYQVDYKKVLIICYEHGPFYQTAGFHLSGGGCPKCAILHLGDAHRMTSQEFVEKAKAVHGGKYNYDKIKYENNRIKVKILCSKHGDFLQKPNTHLMGHGCPECAVSGFKINQPAIFYYLRVDRGTDSPLYKIGITNRSVQERFLATEIENITILEAIKMAGQDAYEFEQELLREFAEFIYDGPNVLHSGNTEIFTKDIFGMDFKEAS
jgi:hypothetical protein